MHKVCDIDHYIIAMLYTSIKFIIISKADTTNRNTSSCISFHCMLYHQLTAPVIVGLAASPNRCITNI